MKECPEIAQCSCPPNLSVDWTIYRLGNYLNKAPTKPPKIFAMFMRQLLAISRSIVFLFTSFYQ